MLSAREIEKAKCIGGLSHVRLHYEDCRKKFHFHGRLYLFEWKYEELKQMEEETQRMKALIGIVHREVVVLL